MLGKMFSPWCIFFLSLCLHLGSPVHAQTDLTDHSELQKTGCSCIENECSCCADIYIPDIMNSEVRHPPPLCVGPAFMKKVYVDMCLRMDVVEVENSTYICFEFEIEFLRLIKAFCKSLGCIRIYTNTKLLESFGTETDQTDILDIKLLDNTDLHVVYSHLKHNDSGLYPCIFSGSSIIIVNYICNIITIILVHIVGSL